MSSDELGRKDQRLLDGITLADAAHEEGQLEAFEEAYARAQEAHSLEALADDLRLRIDEIKQRREQSP